MADSGELDALVVRNIGDIAAAMKHAIEKLGPRLWDELGKALLAATDFSSWYASSDVEEQEIWTAHRSWLIPDADPANADFWLGLDERTAFGNDGEDSWIASFTGSGPNRATAALWIDQTILGKVAWKRLVKSNLDLVDELRTAGFGLDEDDDRRLFLPITIDREKLALAFENGDFDTAMIPIVEARRRIVEALPVLDKLRNLTRM